MAFAVFAGLGVYFLSVGLDQADKIASVVGALVGLAGLGLAAHGMFSASSRTPEPPQASGDVHNEIGGTVHGILSKPGISMVKSPSGVRARRDTAVSRSGSISALPAFDNGGTENRGAVRSVGRCFREVRGGGGRFLFSRFKTVPGKDRGGPDPNVVDSRRR